MDKIDESDLMKGKLFEAQLRALQAETMTKALEFQAWVDALYSRHGLVKGIDRIEENGDIVRGKKEAA